MRKLLFLMMMHVVIDVSSQESMCPGYNRYVMVEGPPAAAAAITLYEELNTEPQYGNSHCYKTCSSLGTCNYFLAQGDYCYYGLEAGDNGGLVVSAFVPTNENVYMRQDLDGCAHAKECEKAGICVDERFTYSCDCPCQYSGRHCEEVAQFSSMHFNGNLNSYVLDTQLMSNFPGYRINYEITVEFTTTAPNGIITYSGGDPTKIDDHIAHYINNGYVTHSINNFDSTVTVRTSGQYNDGLPHTAKFVKLGKFIEVHIVDTSDYANDTGTGTGAGADNNGNWYFGGLKTAAVVTEVERHLGAGNVVGWNGCLRNLNISSSCIDASSEVSNVQHCG